MEINDWPSSISREAFIAAIAASGEKRPEQISAALDALSELERMPQSISLESGAADALRSLAAIWRQRCRVNRYITRPNERSQVDAEADGRGARVIELGRCARELEALLDAISSRDRDRSVEGLVVAALKRAARPVGSSR